MKVNLINLMMAFSVVFYPICNSASANISEKFEFGVCTHVAQQKYNSQRVVGLMSEIGATSFRDEYYWSRLERTPNQFSNAQVVDGVPLLINESSRRGANSLILLSYGNSLYDDGGLPRTESYQEAFARYASFVASSFKGKVKYYEVWNEWNIGKGSGGKAAYGQPAEYASLLKKVYLAIKAADKDAIVLGGSMTNLDSKWMSDFLDTGSDKYMDGIALHPYNYFSKKNKPEDVISWLDKMKLLQVKKHLDIPMYITEIGWPSYIGMYGATDKMSSNYLIRFFSLASSRKFVKGVWWYDLVNDGSNLFNKEDNFGLFDARFDRKNQAVAFKFVTDVIGKSDLVSEVKVPSGLRAVQLVADKSTRYLLWSESDSQRVRINFTERFSVTEINNGALSGAVTNYDKTSSTLEIGPSPVLVVGDGEMTVTPE